MKFKHLLPLLLSATTLAACAPAASVGYTIEGEIEGLSGKLYLTTYEGKLPQRIDSTEVVNGIFTLQGSTELPMYAAIESSTGQALTHFFLENVPLRMTGSAASPKSIQVVGSTATDTYYAFKAEMDSIRPLIYIDSLAKVSAAAADSMTQELVKRKLQFVGANPASIAAAYVFYRELAYYLPVDTLRARVAAFDPALSGSVYLNLVSTMADALERTAVGQPYTDISGTTPEGDSLALSSVVGEGRYVLLEFWASWCRHCRYEYPALKAAYEAFAPKGFEIFAVSLDKTHKDWVGAIAAERLRWKHVSELKHWSNAGADSYGVRAIPSNVLIGPDGVIVGRNLSGEALYAKLAELMGQPE